MMYALFKGEAQVSRAHTTWEAAAVEAFERHAVVQSRGWKMLATGYEIRSIDAPPTAQPER